MEAQEKDLRIVSIMKSFALGHWSKAPENIPPYVIIHIDTQEPVEYGYDEEEMKDHLLTWKAQEVLERNPGLIQEIEKDLGIELE